MKKILLLSISILVLCFGLSAQYGMSFDMSLDDSGWTSSSGANNVLWRTTTDAPASVGGVSSTARHGSGYVYSETTGGFPGQGIAYLESPCFDLPNDITRIQFYYQLAGSVSNFELEVSYDDGASYSPLINLSTSAKSSWTRSNTTGLSISTAAKFRFVVSFDANNSSIVTIDQLQFFGASQGDAGDCPDPDNANCPENLVLDDPSGIGSDIYRASDMITANQETQTGADVALNAGNRILLTDGFSTSKKVDGDFSARIRDCVSDNPTLLEEYVRPDPIAEEEVDYFDRFGNGYARYELEEMMFHEHNTCTKGVFRLNFDPQIPQDQQDVACAVFEYLDGLITADVEDGTVMVDIQSDRSLNSNVPAAAAPFWNRLDCGIANSVVEKILIGGDPNQFGIPHGYIKINSDFDDNFYTDLNTAPDPVDDEGQLHFYTIMLHEALHILGFASLISAPDNAPLVGDAYSRYDQYLFSLAEMEYLLNPITGDCCDAHEYQPDNDPLATCGNTSFRDGTINIATVNGNQTASRLNLLSHFNSTCDTKDYVMHPGIPRVGDTDGSATAIRDVLTCEELQVLSLIGYDVDAAISNQTNCNATTTGGCDVLAVDDFPPPYEPAPNGADLMITIPIADITANDKIKGDDGIFTYDMVTDPVFTVSDDGTDLIITIANSVAGSYFIDYTLTACGGEVCDDGIISILVRGCIADPQANPCEDCDLICGNIGNFECFGGEDEMRILLAGGLSNEENFGFTRDVNSPDMPPNYNIDCNGSEPESYASIEGINSIGVVGFAGPDGFDFSEGIVVPLCEGILPNEEVEINFLALAPMQCMTFNPSMRVEFLTPDPVAGVRVGMLNPPPFFCQDVPVNLEGSNRYTIQCTNNTNEPWNYVLFSARLGAGANGGTITIDDIRVTKQKSITITPTASSNDLCQEGRLSMTYELFNDHCSPSGDLTVDLTVPNSMTLQNIGAFADGTSISLESFEPFERRTIQAFLNVDADATIGQSVDVTLEVEPSDMNNCYMASTDVQTIDIISSPLTSITKSEPTIEDDGLFRTYSFELTVCNGLEEDLEKVLIIDNIPPEFDLETGVPGDDPFQLVVSIDIRQVQLETSMAAASGGSDNCQVFRYSIRTLSDFCPFTALALARVPDSGCDDVTDEIRLIDTNLPEPIADFEKPEVDCMDGEATFVSMVSGSGLMHTWDFDDGTTSTLESPTHIFATNGTYFVTHTVDNGCEPPQTATVKVEFEPCPDNFNCNCANPTEIGNPDPDAPPTNISDTNLGASFTNNTCMKIAGTLIIDQDFTLIGGDVLLEHDAKIIVEANQTLTINGGATLQSCENYMWEGIELEPNANLVITNSNIYDADTGVRSQGTASLNITGTTFDRNRVGMSIVGTPVNLGFENNTFSCSSPLRNSTMNMDNWGLYGILLQGTFQIGDSGPGVEANTFKDTYFGILAAGASQLEVYDADFMNFRYDEDRFRIRQTNGIGIFGTQFSSVTAQNNTFNNVYEGIHIHFSSCRLNNNVITKANYGIFIEEAFFDRAIANNNNIQAAKAGIWLESIIGADFVSLSSNTISMDYFDFAAVEQGSDDPNAFGIKLSLFERAGFYMNMNNNNITIESIDEIFDPLMIGIDVESSSSVDLINNTINVITDPVLGPQIDFGIRVMGSEDILLNDCTVNSDFTTTSAIRVLSTINSSYCCNTVDVSGEGFYFDGGCMGTALNRNRIGSANKTMDNGLICQDGTELSPQIFNDPNIDGLQRHRGNLWLSDDYADFGARHLGVSEERANSRFTVKNDEDNDNFYPYDQGVRSVLPPDFFGTNPELSSVAACDQNIECLLGGVEQDDDSSTSRLNSLAARPPYTEGQYSDLLNWEFNQYLLGLTNDNPTLSGDAIEAFRLAQRNTDLEELMIIKEQRSLSSNPRQAEIRELRTSIEEQLNQMQGLKADYRNAESEAEQTNIIQAYKTLIQEVDQLTVNYQDIIRTFEKQVGSRLNRLRFDNSLVRPSNIFAANEQIVNDIQLFYLSDLQGTLSDNQATALYNVANQCPKEGGRSVYRARALYHFLVAPVLFDDEVLCGTAVEERSIVIEEIVKQPRGNMKLYPNPTAEELNIALDGYDLRQEISIELYDFTGKIVMIQSLTKENTNLSLYRLDDGIYFCSLLIDGIKQETQKVVLIK